MRTPMRDACTFCDSIDGDVPSFELAGDENAVAFLEANPATDGHTLVVPRDHAAELTDLDTEQTAALFGMVRTVASVIEDVLDPAGVTLVQSNGAAAGQDVFHAHVHVIPRYVTDDVTIEFEPTELDETRAKTLEKRLSERL